MSSYYQSEISLFVNESDSSIIGKLASQHRHDLESQQREAWANQLKILKRELVDIPGHIFIEFTIPRIGKRADCIVVTGSTVFVIEFKNGASKFDKDAIDQAHDYALDLKDFHLGSHKAAIIPILVATASLEKAAVVKLAHDDVANPVTSGAIGLGDLIKTNSFQYGKPLVDPVVWAASGYAPTPTIIEAARSLYENKKVKDIMRSEAGEKNLTLTTSKISEIIDDCKREKKKAICFVTGVPGAGKRWLD
jgi:hypothetical protein